jgi:hypothetical protein
MDVLLFCIVSRAQLVADAPKNTRSRTAKTAASCGRFAKFVRLKLAAVVPASTAVAATSTTVAAAATATAAAVTAATAAAAVTATAAATTTAVTAAPTRRASFTWTSFVHGERTTFDSFAVELRDGIVTNAKPRDLPVNLSCISATSCTAPACEKRS